MRSIWGDGIKVPSTLRLEGDRKCDVLIIGGGMAGILCAHKMRASGI